MWCEHVALHADNGRFADNAFIKDAKEQRQSISYCVVNAHHQNGKVEQRIRDLQVQVRVMLIRAIHQWRGGAAPQLWPYAIRLVNEIINLTPKSKDGAVPLSLFTKSNHPTTLETLHPFVCPAYVLENALQQAKKLVNGKIGVESVCILSHRRHMPDLYTLSYQSKQD